MPQNYTDQKVRDSLNDTRIRPLKAFVFCAVLSLIFILPGPSHADYDYIDITNPFLRKIPLAVQPFKLSDHTPENEKAAAEAMDLIAQTLEFTGYFKIISPEAFLVDSKDPAIIRPNIEFANWTGIGAELLVTGGLQMRNGLAEVELRLFDTFKQRLVVGKKYRALPRDLRRVVRRFCSAILFNLTGSRGYFDSDIAFVSNGSGKKEVFLCDFDGFNPRPFTNNRSITLFPAWSSDRKWIAYTAFNTGKPNLYIKSVSRKRGYVLGKKGININPDWVPGRFELAATLSFAGDQEIYLLTGTGKIIKRLTHSRGIDVSPSWSPDGKRMAFVSKRSGTPQVYIKTIATGAVERVTFEGRYNTQPDWSPQGDRIVFSALRNGQSNLFLIRLDGGDPVQLTQDSGDNEAPSWAPDGSLIAFSSTREGPSRIYVMTAYGTDQRRLLSMPGEQSSPAWSSNGLYTKVLSGS
ncbi:MAG: Tol-Pal system beta propeller repeat protein TolB [Desulfobacterales bacterium]|nr:Tol-Pal system beta propeller repeat protein TolB [Desulfobacterales bacterium]